MKEKTLFFYEKDFKLIKNNTFNNVLHNGIFHLMNFICKSHEILRFPYLG